MLSLSCPSAGGGRVSDKELTLNSGFLDQLEYDDQVPQCKHYLFINGCYILIVFFPFSQVMADRGFLIKEELLCRGASLVIPSFTKGKNQLREREVVTSRKIANLRIHVKSMNFFLFI